MPVRSSPSLSLSLPSQFPHFASPYQHIFTYCKTDIFIVISSILSDISPAQPSQFFNSGRPVVSPPPPAFVVPARLLTHLSHPLPATFSSPILPCSCYSPSHRQHSLMSLVRPLLSHGITHALSLFPFVSCPGPKLQLSRHHP